MRDFGWEPLVLKLADYHDYILSSRTTNILFRMKPETAYLNIIQDLISKAMGEDIIQILSLLLM